jgi:hypothetical protein
VFGPDRTGPDRTGSDRTRQIVFLIGRAVNVKRTKHVGQYTNRYALLVNNATSTTAFSRCFPISTHISCFFPITHKPVLWISLVSPHQVTVYSFKVSCQQSKQSGAHFTVYGVTYKEASSDQHNQALCTDCCTADSGTATLFPRLHHQQTKRSALPNTQFKTYETGFKSDRKCPKGQIIASSQHW